MVLPELLVKLVLQVALEPPVFLVINLYQSLHHNMT